MSKIQEKKETSFTYRLPLEINERLDRDAAENFRSKNQHLTWIVDQYFQSQKNTQPEQQLKEAALAV